MTPEELHRRLENLDPTVGEIREHFYAMQAETQSPAYRAKVYARLEIEYQRSEIGLTNYHRFIAGGCNWSLDDYG